MVAKNIIAPLIEETTSINENGAGYQEQEKTFAEYQYFSTGFGFYALAAVKKSVKGAPYEVETTIDQYDQYANILQKTSEGGDRVAYLWGYNGRYLVAEVQGLLIRTYRLHTNPILLFITLLTTRRFLALPVTCERILPQMR
ncbi:hypothetical protein [Niabella hibiscisoli]|uniref:hypothetical protein n=1 Tax=Niabella hibiscisoli TaxID=1825928 RepID=UPI001F0E66E7|nr:hypothetical protein [Niabella hibiscisoli]MCH5718256.1 hypothetical protein [Niabella hibiscisoli]